MATTYQQQYATIQTDTAFVGRITAAAVFAAISIYNENPAITSHAQRAVLAVAVMKSPESYARQFAWAVVSDPTIDPTGVVTDGTLFSRIGAQWNVLAGV